MDHLLTFLNKETTDKLLNSFNNESIHCFRLNTLKCSNINDIIKQGRGVNPHLYVKDAYLYDKSEYELGKSILFHAGAYYIQDSSAMMATYILNIKENDKVLDMCAAPGGKSFNALLDLSDKGLLVCNDIHEIRSKILSSNIEKYGFKNAIVLNDDSKNYSKYFINYFDKIILDAPCSGSAMFRKNDEAKNDWSIEKVLQCKQIQLSLLEDAYKMLKGQGMLLYSTCSFSIQENEEVINEFLLSHNDMNIVNIDLSSVYDESINIKGGLRLYPHKFKGEGQTIFLLKKNNFDNYKKGRELRNVKSPKELLNFLDSIKFNYLKDNFIYFKNHYYYVEFDKFDLSNIKVNRFGLEIGEMIKDRFVPSHALAMYHKLDKSNFIELNKQEAISYLKGLTISRQGSSGYKVVSYNGLALGWVKHVNNTLKNHYPKGLRVNLE